MNKELLSKAGLRAICKNAGHDSDEFAAGMSFGVALATGCIISEMQHEIIPTLMTDRADEFKVLAEALEAFAKGKTTTETTETETKE